MFPLLNSFRQHNTSVLTHSLTHPTHLLIHSLSYFLSLSLVTLGLQDIVKFTVHTQTELERFAKKDFTVSQLAFAL